MRRHPFITQTIIKSNKGYENSLLLLMIKFFPYGVDKKCRWMRNKKKVQSEYRKKIHKKKPNKKESLEALIIVIIFVLLFVLNNLFKGFWRKAAG